jgi:hypothetical protein
VKAVSTKLNPILCEDESAIISQIVDAAVSYGIDRSHVERTVAWCSFVSAAVRFSTERRAKGNGWQATALDPTNGVHIEVSDKRRLSSIIGIPKDADLMSILNTLSLIAVRLESDEIEWQGVVAYGLYCNLQELAFTYVPFDVVFTEHWEKHA